MVPVIPEAIIYSSIVTLVGLISLYMNILTYDGFIAGLVIGIPIILFGGINWFILLLAFFVLGGLLSRIGRDKKALYNRLNERVGVRAWPNVIANGLWPMLASALFPVYQNSEMGFLLIIFYVSSLNSMVADTTATEIGLLYGDRPRLITSLRSFVEKGVSGGVTLIGFLSSFVTASIYAIIGYYLIGFYDLFSFLVPVVIGGVLGNVFDSVLGGILQSKYRCSVCGIIVEVNRHCGGDAEHISGWRWIDNHVVNFLSSFLGGVSAILIYVVFL
jgi:uncharacterized protein (TIGR00297 family)